MARWLDIVVLTRRKNERIDMGYPEPVIGSCQDIPYFFIQYILSTIGNRHNICANYVQTYPEYPRLLDCASPLINQDMIGKVRTLPKVALRRNCHR